jgi:methylenetetrahydrofolate reductase (NADPH)
VRAARRERLAYRASCGFHDWCFEPRTRFFRWAARFYRFVERHPVLNRLTYWFERLAKTALFSCRECGDCSLPDTNYICPESQCRKRQRNGPCGGSFRGTCEVEDRPCLWVRAYQRSRGGAAYDDLFERPPVFVDDKLRETSSWANTFLGRDSGSYRAAGAQRDG